MRSAQQSGAGLTAAPRDSDRWNTETWLGFGGVQAPDSFVPVGFTVPIGGRTLLDIETEVAVRALEMPRLDDLLDPPPGGPVLPWDPPPVQEVKEVLALRRGCPPPPPAAPALRDGGCNA